MKNRIFNQLTTAISTITVVGIIAAGAALADPLPAPDGADAKRQKFESLRGVRYCELFFITGDPKTGLTANFVNTSALNNSADPKDTCPPAIWDKITPDSLKSQYKVAGIFKNGPRWWVNDVVDIPAGAVGTYDNLEGRWFGKVDLPKTFGKPGGTAYKPTTVGRKSVMQFNKGEPVYILDDPDGMPWVMQAFTTKVNPKMTYDGLMTLAETLKPAEGWSYRVKILDEPLTIQAVDGVARIVQDEFEGTYNACFDTACSFKP
ncbi:hypothetical protein [Falsihalocynthiibacter sp. CO-5D18]|uniref:hypothetical protein n=1 Tax=Falsihalocynthiibacter sp. CO-5D18 TaxID=3240872 RepID=UPI003510C391